MPLMITLREAVLINTGQASVLARAHTKVHYPRGAKVPCVLDQVRPSPIGLQMTGAVETTLGGIDDARARQMGFKNKAEFRTHWNGLLYGEGGLDDSGGSRKREDTKLVMYRFKRADVVQKRVSFTA